MEIKDKNLYYIGGIVRDRLLKLDSFDTDLIYVGNAIQYVKTLSDVEIIQINESFGTVRIRVNDEIIDIASSRSEYYPKKGHLPEVVEIGCDLKKDIMRRDFTINSLAQSTLTGEIIDFVGGLEDLKNKKLRVLHDNSFIDDPTRIIRGLKFGVRFGFELEEKTQKLQENYLSRINYNMSYKRLKKELEETFNLNRWEAFEKFIDQKIFKLLGDESFELPEFDFSGLVALCGIKDSWIIYIGLLKNVEKLPLTKYEKRIVENFRKLCNLKIDTDFEIYKAFSSVDIASVIMYTSVSEQKVNRYFEFLKNVKIELSGKDLQALGIPSSPVYQECFDYVLRKKIANPQLTFNDEILLAKDFFGRN